ncbi:MAG: ABC transporter permease [Oscillospiraceae bacterium]|nr:ABC transporter permease [Oscillospiraceae bacterium]
MSSLRLYFDLFIRDLKKLCRQWILPAGLVLFCAVLLAGPAAARLLADGIEFDGMTIAVTAPEGDATPELVEQVGGNLRDVRQYCSFRAMSRGEAEEALAAGEVAAVLDLPGGFLEGVMVGTNPDVTLTVESGAPLKALLACTFGHAASDMLTAFQASIYDVIDSYEASPPAGLSYDDMIFAINLRTIGWALGREACFKIREVSATGALSPAEHYAYSLLAYLALACAPLAAALYAPARLRARKRLRAAGHGAPVCWLSSVCASAAVLLPVIFAVSLLIGAGPLNALLAAVVWAAFAGLGYAFVSLLTPNVSGCGTIAFLAALAALFISGGIVPPVLLPAAVQKLSPLSPVTGMRALAAGTPDPAALAALAAEGALLAVLGALLYKRRMERGEAK